MLKKNKVAVEIIDYVKTPPAVEELNQICQGLNLEPLALIRTKDKLFRELGLTKDDQRSREEWLRIIAEHPALMERPVVQYKNRFILGRPPEVVASILD